MKKHLLALAAVGILGTISAHADGLTFAGTYAVSGNGFGANARALTIQSHGPVGTESGCIAPNGSGGLIAGSGACAPGGANMGGDEQMPIGFPKQSAPTLTSLGVTSGSQIGILFDGVQPQNGKDSSLSIDNLTLKLFSGTTLAYTATGTFQNLTPGSGNGISDYLFVLSSSQVAAFDAALNGNLSDTLALDATITFSRQSAGPDSFSFVNLNTGTTTPPTAPTPEPSSLLLLGTGILGSAFTLKRSRA